VINFVVDEFTSLLLPSSFVVYAPPYFVVCAK
jgi:hypothetical protein